MTLTRLSELVGVSIVNLSVLKNDRARAIRFSTLQAICDALAARSATCSRSSRGTDPAQPRSRCRYPPSRSAHPGARRATTTACEKKPRVRSSDPRLPFLRFVLAHSASQERTKRRLKSPTESCATVDTCGLVTTTPPDRVCPLNTL